MIQRIQRIQPSRSIAIPLSVVACLGAGDPAEFDWRCDEGGTFSQGSCWEDTFFPPGENDTAVFDVGSAYTVDFEKNTFTDRLVVRSGFVTFDLAELQYTLLNPSFPAPSIVVGDAQPANAHLAASNGSVHGEFVTLGRAVTTTGTLDVVGSNALLSASQLTVGDLGTGLLTLTGGAAIDAGYVDFGFGSAATAIVTLDGAGTALHATQALKVGRGGTAILTVDDGAVITTPELIFGQQVGSIALVTISGAGSALCVDGTIDVGLVGFGNVVIENGATLTNEIFAVLGTSGTADDDFGEQDWGTGIVLVDGAGSQWTVNGDLYVGLVGNGQIGVARGGRIVVDGDIFTGFQQRDLFVGLGASDDYPTGAIQANGVIDDILDITVGLLDDFVPQAGDRFVIAEAPQIDWGVNLVLELPPLPPPLVWSVQHEIDIVALDVIAISGDVDGNGVVDVLDLIQIITSWGDCPGCPADLDGDGLVGVSDLIIVITTWG